MGDKNFPQGIPLYYGRVSRRSREPIYRTAVAGGLAIFRFLRLRRRESGLENIPAEGGAVLAMTHFGYLEFALVEWSMWLHNRRRIRFLATKSVFEKPVLGTVMRGMHHIPVDMTAGADAFAKAIDALKAGELIGVFPEAGVSASFTVRELKTGAIRLAAEAGVPVIPVAVWGGQRLLTKNRKIRLRERIGVLVSFAYGRPVEVAPGQDAVTVSEELRVTMQGLVDELQRDYPVDGTGMWWQPKSLGGTAPTPVQAAEADAARARRRQAEADAAE
jgi:1-acyl-sn-glycerol-3-phosphate acyltransferase